MPSCRGESRISWHASATTCFTPWTFRRRIVPLTRDWSVGRCRRHIPWPLRQTRQRLCRSLATPFPRTGPRGLRAGRRLSRGGCPGVAARARVPSHTSGERRGSRANPAAGSDRRHPAIRQTPPSPSPPGKLRSRRRRRFAVGNRPGLGDESNQPDVAAAADFFCAAVCAMRRPMREAHSPRPLHDKATTNPWPQVVADGAMLRLFRAQGHRRRPLAGGDPSRAAKAMPSTPFRRPSSSPPWATHSFATPAPTACDIRSRYARYSLFKAEHHDWSGTFSGRSQVGLQLSTEDFYRDFASRAVPADVHGILLRVASIEDTLAGKMKAWRTPERWPSKSIKDLGDIVRLIERLPFAPALERPIRDRSAPRHHVSRSCLTRITPSRRGCRPRWRPPAGRSRRA